MLKNQKIGIRLAFGFSFILIIFIGVFGFIVIQLNSLSNITNLIYNHPLTVSNAVLRIDGNITRIHRSMKDVALAQNPAEIEKAVQLVNEYEKQVYQDFDIVEDRFLGEKYMYQDARQAFTEWKPIREKVIQLMYENKRQQAADITKGIGARHVEKLNQAMLALENFAQNKAKTFQRKAIDTHHQAIIFTYSFIFLGLLTSSIFIYFFSKSISTPLSELMGAVQEISSGKFEKRIAITSGDEIGQLANAFNIMTAKLQASYQNLESRINQRTEELEQTNKNLKYEIHKHQMAREDLLLHAQALDNMLEGVQIFKIDDGIIIYTNNAFVNMLGYNKNELIGTHTSSIIAATKRSPEETAAAIISKLTTHGEWEGELYNIKKDRTVFWTRAKASVFKHSVLGKIGIVVQEDISERKKADEKIKAALYEKETLLRELYHRTKNNMQVIRSIISLQRAYSNNHEVEMMFQETENKIQAMALVHQKLYQSKDLSKINLAEYFGELVDLIMSSYHEPTGEIERELDLQDIHVLIDYAIPCGLILNELLSNSLKHAFHRSAKGLIKIKLSRNDQGEINLEYSDNGTGVPQDFNFRSQKTLGLQTIITITEHQLQGKIEFTPENGLACLIRFSDMNYVARV